MPPKAPVKVRKSCEFEDLNKCKIINGLGNNYNLENCKIFDGKVLSEASTGISETNHGSKQSLNDKNNRRRISPSLIFGNLSKDSHNSADVEVVSDLAYKPLQLKTRSNPLKTQSSKNSYLATKNSEKRPESRKRKSSILKHEFQTNKNDDIYPVKSQLTFQNLKNDGFDDSSKPKSVRFSDKDT